MTDWRKASTFCNGCDRWRSDITHRDCSRGSRGSLVWVDIDNFQQGCNKCNETWTLESSVLYCTCGHVQRTEYVDSIDALQVGEQVVATDGNLVYVRTRTGTIVVGKRSFPGAAYY